MDIRKTIDIACTPAALWPWLTEPALLKEWVPGFVEETPDDPARTGLGAGSTMKLREGSRVSSYRCVVTAWEPGRAVAIRLTGGAFAKDMHMDVAYTVAPTERGCRLDYRAECDLKGFYRLLAPLFWLGGRGNATKALNRLSSAAEGARAATA